MSAMAIAGDLDRLAPEWPTAPTFFHRTSAEVCKAIATPGDPNRKGVLEVHCKRIDDPRLRRAFATAIDLDDRARSTRRLRATPNLWVGLDR